MLDVLRHVIQQHREDVKPGGGQIPTNTAYLKFYHPVSFRHEGHFKEWLLLAVILGSFLTLCYLYLARLRLITQWNRLWQVWLILVLYSLFVFGTIGRDDIVRLRKLVMPHWYTYEAGSYCCTQAVLYPALSARNIARYLEMVLCKPGFGKDHALGQYAYDNRMPVFVVQPNTFTHIGCYSSLGTGGFQLMI